MFISSRSSTEESMNVHRYHQRSQRRELLFSFPQKSRKSSYVSASNEYIAATGRDSNHIKLYDRKSKVVSPQQPVSLKVVFSLHFSPDGGLLVTGHDNVKEMIIKYRISGEGGLDLVWSCDQVAGACGVTTDEMGLIYVCGQKNKTIYVLSSEGKMQIFLLEILYGIKLVFVLNTLRWSCAMQDKCFFVFAEKDLQFF